MPHYLKQNMTESRNGKKEVLSLQMVKHSESGPKGQRIIRNGVPVKIETILRQ